MAMVPARAPGPKIPMNNSAHTSEFTERDETSTSFATKLIPATGTRLRAARTPIGSARTIESNVPSVAIWIVSINASWTLPG